MRNKIIEEDLNFIIDSQLPWNLLEGRNILITGANGFISSYLVETILFLNEKRFKNKSKVFALARNKEHFQHKFNHHSGREDLVLINQDVCDPFQSADRIDYIIHAASQASPKYYGKDPVGTISANTIGTNNMLELAKENNVMSLLFISSGEVYGEVSQNEIPIKENSYGYIDPTALRSCYAEGKRAGETMLVSWWNQYGLNVKIVRPFHTYGPGMMLDDGRVHADFVSNIVHNTNIVMKSDGSAIRSFCYIADAVLGIYTVLFRGNIAEPYNVGDENGSISIYDLAVLLANMFPEKMLKVEKNEGVKPEGYIKSTISINSPNTSKIRSLGWQPHFSLKAGFKRTIRSFL